MDTSRHADRVGCLEYADLAGCGRLECQGGPTLRFAAGFWQRLRGLIARPPGYLASHEALCFVGCPSVHTFGMRVPIDVAFLDASGRVLKSVRRLPPRRLVVCRGSSCALERVWHPHTGWFSAGQQVQVVAVAQTGDGRGKGGRP